MGDPAVAAEAEILLAFLHTLKPLECSNRGLMSEKAFVRRDDVLFGGLLFLEGSSENLPVARLRCFEEKRLCFAKNDWQDVELTELLTEVEWFGLSFRVAALAMPCLKVAAKEVLAAAILPGAYSGTPIENARGDYLTTASQNMHKLQCTGVLQS
jgi:hypothetical protein